jgi:hypothetical protein
MSALEKAACIGGEVGGCADPAIANDDEFDLVDRQNRISAAADELVDWVRDLVNEPFTRGGSQTEMVARLIASAMVAQRACDDNEHARAEQPRLSVSPPAAEVIKGLVDRLVEGGTA